MFRPSLFARRALSFGCSIALILAASGIVSAADYGLKIRFGLNDNKPTKWDGTVEVASGRVTHIGGWRFAKGDEVDGTTGWKASTRPVAAQAGRGNNQKKAAERAAKNNDAAQPINDNGVVISFADVTADSRVTFKTTQGNFDVTFGDIQYGAIVEKLDGAVEVERTAAAAPLTTDRTDDDYPAAAVATDGTTYVAYVSFTHGDRSAYRPLQEPGATTSFANSGRGWKTAPENFDFLKVPVGGDRVRLHTVRDGKASEPIDVTAGGGDIYKCGVTVDGSGKAWIVWAENTAYPSKDANFEILARSYDGKLGEIVKLSDRAGSDLNPVVATASDGRVWCAWQAVRDGAFRIVERHQSADGSWSAERAVSTQKRNCWTPAIAAGQEGRIAIAWDTYEKGDYDVWVREFGADGKPSDARAAADTIDYEARPSLTYDPQGALWIGYELGSPSWGKDSGPYDNGGNPLYRGRQIGLIVLNRDGTWVEPKESYVGSLPHAKPRKKVNNQRVAPMEPGGESPTQARAAELMRDAAYNNLARITCDKSGRIWVLCRSRQNDIKFPTMGSLWLSWAVYYDGAKWTGPILLPNSDNLMYNVPAVVALPGGGLLTAHSSDHRQDRFPDPDEIKYVPGGADDPFDNDVFLTRLDSPDLPVKKYDLRAAQYPPTGKTEPTPATVAELAAINRCRTQTAEHDGRKLRLIRGEYHRHTEISGDGGNDGPLEDMWRYALDVSSMDWLGNSDHDNGAGREYTWWLTQKTTDAFRIAGKFEPPFTYERSVRYPEGHRNVMFPTRGIRTLPRLPITDRDYAGKAPDTQMLYRYLHQFGGVCASHTSATSMGTDWRDNDPIVEPMVEIYQGDRQNYERPGAPRCPTADYSIGGWEPKGFVNLALMKGYRLAFQCSSDHLSTHISYAMVYAEDCSREALVKAIRERHIYGSTDNIVADFRSKANGKEYMLGDEFTTSEAPTFRVKLVGTEPFAKITLVKDDVEIPLPCESKSEIEVSWTDPQPTAGKTSYYYVRGEQTDGEVVWVSPMWVKYDPKAAAGAE